MVLDIIKPIHDLEGAARYMAGNMNLYSDDPYNVFHYNKKLLNKTAQEKEQTKMHDKKRLIHPRRSLEIIF
jgi:hypothetical protein